jgi:branched-chain amino acid transport system ATP-binding protein
MDNAAPILRLRGVGRRFGGVQAVRGVDLDVFPGERRAILGPNGAGKTTLFNLVSGEFPPTAGQIDLFGRDVTRQPARKRAHAGLTRTYQTSRLFLGLSVEDNLYLSVLGIRGGHLRPVRLSGRDGRMRARAHDLAERVGLGGQLATLVGSLSHGEQRQLEVAMVLATKPRLLLLDEPMAGMGPDESQRMIALLSTLKRKQTIVLVEHDMDAVFRLADRISVLVYGRIIATGAPAEIRANPEVRAAYLGEES